MEDYPKTLAELEARFSTEEDCVEYLFSLRWPEGFVCPRCSGGGYWPTKRGLFTCSSCQYQASVKAGTIFERSRLPLVTWFRAIWWVTSQKNGASAKGLQRILGMGGYKTAWSWLHKLRRAMVRPDRDRLKGIVEVDEVYIGGEKPGKRGRGASGKSLVLVAAEVKGNHLGRIRLSLIEDASAKSIDRAIMLMVEKKAVVRTDEWKGYTHLTRLGYQHEVARKDAQVGVNVLPRCNRVAALLKRWLLGTHQGAVSHEHLAYYLDEYTFRFNRRSSRYRGKLFYRLIQQAVEIQPVPYDTLIKHVRGRKPGKHKM